MRQPPGCVYWPMTENHVGVWPCLASLADSGPCTHDLGAQSASGEQHLVWCSPGTALWFQAIQTCGHHTAFNTVSEDFLFRVGDPPLSNRIVWHVIVLSGTFTSLARAFDGAGGTLLRIRYPVLQTCTLPQTHTYTSICAFCDDCHEQDCWPCRPCAITCEGI